MSEDKSFLKRLLTETWPAKMAKDALSALMLPGDVYQGKVSMYGDDGRTNPEVINRSADLAGLVTLGAGAVPAEANSLRSGIKAYHGSPHDFDRFDLSKIGTGEGAQAYGHGLYFAEQENIAKGYRDRISGAKWVDRNGREVRTNDIVEDISSEARKSGFGIVEAEKMAFNWRDYIDNPYAAPDPIKNVLKKNGIRLDGQGSMYEVNINADPARFLDWDKPLSSQPDSIIRSVEAAMGGPSGARKLLSDYERIVPKNLYAEFPSGGHVGDKVNVWDRKGSDIHALLSGSAFSAGDALAAQKLREAGIPGIKYLDQGSRAAGDGSRNYVVLDDKLIDILRKYGLAGASASPLAALMAGQGQGELQQ